MLRSLVGSEMCIRDSAYKNRLNASSTKFRPPRKRPGSMKYSAITAVRKKKTKLTLLNTKL